MKRNIGTADRIIRIFVAVLIGFFYFTGVLTGTLGIVLMVLGVVFLATSFISFCPIYSIFGLTTAKKEEDK